MKNCFLWKQLGIWIEFTYISDLMLWVHCGKFVNAKWVKIPSSTALQVAKYMRTDNYCAWAIKEQNFSWKKIVFKFFGCQFSLTQKQSLMWRAVCIRASQENLILENISIWHIFLLTFCFIFIPINWSFNSSEVLINFDCLLLMKLQLEHVIVCLW